MFALPGNLSGSIEHIYQDAGDLSSDASGLLLTMRKDSTMFILALLTIVLKTPVEAK